MSGDAIIRHSLLVHRSLRLRSKLLHRLLNWLISRLLLSGVELSRWLLLHLGHRLSDGALTLLAQLSLRVSVRRVASRLHHLAVDVLLLLNVRIEGVAVRALGSIARVNSGHSLLLGDGLHRRESSLLLHRLLLEHLRRSTRHDLSLLVVQLVEVALSGVSEVLESVANHSDLTSVKTVARSIDEALDASKLIADRVTRHDNHLAVVILEASGLALLLQMQRHRDQTELLSEGRARSAGRRRLIFTLAAVVDGAKVRQKQTLVKRIVTALIDSQIQNGAANLEQISREVTLEIVHGRLIILLLQVRPNKQIVLRVVEHVVQVALVVLGGQEVAVRQQVQSLEDVNQIELASFVHAEVDDLIIFLVEMADVLHVVQLDLLLLGGIVDHWLRLFDRLVGDGLSLRHGRAVFDEVLRLLEQSFVFGLEHPEFVQGIVADFLELLLVLRVNALLDVLPFIAGQRVLVALSLRHELLRVHVDVVALLHFLLHAGVGWLIVGARDRHSRADLLLRIDLLLVEVEAAWRHDVHVLLLTASVVVGLGANNGTLVEV